jgi:hypothetical protein
MSETTAEPVRAIDRLTGRRRRFVELVLSAGPLPPIADLYVQAGYDAERIPGATYDSATSSAYTLLRHPLVETALAEERQALKVRMAIDADYVLRKLVTMAEASLLDFGHVNDKGELVVDLRRATRDQLQAIQEVVVDETPTGRRTRIKLIDRAKLIKLIGSHIDIRAFMERHSVEASTQLSEALAAGMERARRALDSGARGTEDEIEELLVGSGRAREGGTPGAGRAGVPRGGSDAL